MTPKTVSRPPRGSGIDEAAQALSAGGGAGFNRAICTTDRWPKGGAFRLALNGREVTIGAAAKGAGMIFPSMATMLAYVTVNAPVAAGELQAMTAAAAAGSFNRISVDGQMSPSDTLLVMAAGDGAPVAGGDRDRLAHGLEAVCRWLAIQMVKDGEGAAHAVRVVVSGARDRAEAETVARAVGDSPLVKTAIFGEDPNWGRVSQAVGMALAGAGGPAHEPVVTVNGVPNASEGAIEVLAREEYDLQVALGIGRGERRVARLGVGPRPRLHHGQCRVPHVAPLTPSGPPRGAPGRTTRRGALRPVRPGPAARRDSPGRAAAEP